MNNIILALPVLLPILGGSSLLFSERRLRGKVRDISLEFFVGGLVLLNSLLVAGILLGQRAGGDGLVLFRLFSNLTVQFRIDRMGSVFAGLIAFLWPLATLYSFEYMKEEKRKATFFAYYVMTYGVTVGIAFAGNLTTLYLFYEMLTLVTFPLVLFPLSKEAMRASRTYLYFSIGGAAFAFIGLVFVLSFSATGNTAFRPGGVLDPKLAAESRNLLLFIYVLAFFGFGVKAALFPCHAWLPKATVAPTPVTALLHAVAVVKSGAFAILRFTYFSFGTEFLRGSWAQWLVMGAALFTILFGSTMAVREVHWKRRLAYSTISNLSYILFGAALMTPLGMAAALSHLTAHAFMKICSFFCAGAVMHQTGKTYIYQLDGLGKRMPVTFGCLTVASLSLMGIPLFAGFISKWNLCRAAFSLGGSGAVSGIGAWLPCAGVVVILYSALMTGIYMLSVLVRAYFPGRGTGVLSAASGEAAVTDPGWKMLVPLVIFAAVILLIGLHSGPLMAFLTEIGGEAG